MKAKPQQFRITGNYLYPPVESTEVFPSKEQARATNKLWTAQAKSQGLRWKGRIVPATENSEPIT